MSPVPVRRRFRIDASPWMACTGSWLSKTVGVISCRRARSKSLSRKLSVGDGRSLSRRPSNQSRISLSCPSSPGKLASASCSSRIDAPSSRADGRTGDGSCSTNSHNVIQKSSCWYGPGARTSLGGTPNPRSARKVPTATSRSSHNSTSSWSTAVLVITRATIGAGLRCTSTLLLPASRTASWQRTEWAPATACAAANARAVPDFWSMPTPCQTAADQHLRCPPRYRGPTAAPEGTGRCPVGQSCAWSAWRVSETSCSRLMSLDKELELLGGE